MKISSGGTNSGSWTSQQRVADADVERIERAPRSELLGRQKLSHSGDLPRSTTVRRRGASQWRQRVAPRTAESVTASDCRPLVGS